VVTKTTKKVPQPTVSPAYRLSCLRLSTVWSLFSLHARVIVQIYFYYSLLCLGSFVMGSCTMWARCEARGCDSIIHADRLRVVFLYTLFVSLAFACMRYTIVPSSPRVSYCDYAQHMSAVRSARLWQQYSCRSFACCAIVCIIYSLGICMHVVYNYTISPRVYHTVAMHKHDYWGEYVSTISLIMQIACVLWFCIKYLFALALHACAK